MDTADREALREHLCCEHARGRSWRVQCREDYGGAFSHTVLQKIAVLGVYPKDREILKALGLLKPKQIDEHTKRVRREINRMAKETRKALVPG